MQMRHGNGDGQWKTARVRLYKKNLPFTSTGIDLYFSALGGASNGGTIRNVTVTLKTYEIIPSTWDAGATTVNLLTPANWSSDVLPTSTGFTEATRQDARWDGLISGSLNQSFGAPFGGNFGVGLVLSSNQKGNLTITNSNNAMQNLRIINSTALGLGGIQIANGAGALTIGATGIANPIQLVLGAGTNPLTYYFTNNSNNTATIEENVTIIRGAGHNANLTFNAGNWNIKGRITNLNSGGSFNVSAGTVTLSGANTYTGATNISGGALTLGTANALPIGSAGVIRFSGISPILNLGLFDLGSGTAIANSAGALDFDANSTLNLGTTNSNSYYFKASNVQDWDATTVNIYNWTGTAGLSGTNRRIFVGSDALGLLSAQLAKITFNGYSPGATLLSSGELVPVDTVTRIKGTLFNNTTQAFAYLNANKQLIINAMADSNYNIYNALGMLVENGVVNLDVSTQNSEFITCSQKLIRGIYIVQIIDKGKIHSNKVMVH
jgi:autotransporter-associated beta strand protein